MTPPDDLRAGRLYRAIWRWHFYAGLFCIPFILLLAATGSLYLFKPQIEAAIDRPYASLAITGPLATPRAQIEAALAAVPGSTFAAYQMPERDDAAVQVLVAAEGERTRVYVHPQTLAVLKTVPEEARFMSVVQSIHGELLAGDMGSLVVETAASWAIVMVVTGLYLWWPRSARGLAGVLFPRFGRGARTMWRDVHAVTGVWISGLALALLLTGLPWTQVWGEGFKRVRAMTGLDAVTRDWTQGRAAERAAAAADEHAEHMAAGHAHDMAAMHDMGGGAHDMAAMTPVSVDALVAASRTLAVAPPAMLTPPSKKSPTWDLKSAAQNRTIRTEVAFDPMTGAIVKKTGFKDRHPIDRAVAIGVSAHEGQLFGWANQALGVLAALGLAILSVSAFVMWRTRAPKGALGAPPLADARLGAGVAALILVAAVLLPMFGATLIVVALLDLVVLRRIAPVRRYLGLAPS
ncbi:MAG: PepSY domain-containing protein [Alphaproteobacteria bacterium]|nr:PepSY domain-containing protein [Alphaproteobacteria bacterium]